VGLRKSFGLTKTLEGLVKRARVQMLICLEI
jgi:hypothetical protein